MMRRVFIQLPVFMFPKHDDGGRKRANMDGWTLRKREREKSILRERRERGARRFKVLNIGQNECSHLFNLKLVRTMRYYGTDNLCKLAPLSLLNYRKTLFSLSPSISPLSFSLSLLPDDTGTIWRLLLQQRRFVEREGFYRMNPTITRDEREKCV